MQRISRGDLLGALPIFLLEITWGGRIFRFSSYPLDIQTDGGKSIHYSGGLSDPDWSESMEEMKGPEKNSIPIELVFPVNLLQEFFQFGRLLDNATAELSMVTERGAVVQQTHEKRTRLFSGDIVQPIIGNPERPEGYAAFSIERNPANKPEPIIKATGFFNANSSVSPPAPPAPAVNAPIEFSDGSVYPLIIGRPYQYFYTGHLGAAQNDTLYGSPAFIIHRIITISGIGYYQDFDKFWLCIALGEVAAATVTIRDYQNNVKTGVPVLKFLTSEGIIISYVEMQYAEWTGSAALVDGIVNPWMISGGHAGLEHGNCETDNPRYYVSWSGGGGTLNTYGPGALEGAGDVILYFLDMCGADIDRNAWQNVATYLNNWKIGGYIDDPELAPYQFLQDNVFPFVPVHSVNGADGLRPVIPLIYLSKIPRPIYDVTLGAGFYFVSPVEWASEPEDVVNRLMLRYAFDVFLDGLATFVKIDPEPSNNHGMITSSDLSIVSRTKYGDRYREIEAGYISDFKTAMRAAQYIIRRRALPKMTMEIQADPLYGWLQLGDILSVTSAGYFMENFKLQIIEKSWKNGSWLFTVELENNVSINRRN